jgi:hypothetical protein
MQLFRARETFSLNQSCARTTRELVFTRPRPEAAIGRSKWNSHGIAIELQLKTVTPRLVLAAIKLLRATVAQRSTRSPWAVTPSWLLVPDAASLATHRNC